MCFCTISKNSFQVNIYSNSDVRWRDHIVLSRNLSDCKRSRKRVNRTNERMVWNAFLQRYFKAFWIPTHLGWYAAVELRKPERNHELCMSSEFCQSLNQSTFGNKDMATTNIDREHMFFTIPEGNFKMMEYILMVISGSVHSKPIFMGQNTLLVFKAVLRASLCAYMKSSVRCLKSRSRNWAGFVRSYFVDGRDCSQTLLSTHKKTRT